MVCTLLVAAGFEVHYLGIDVPAQKFVDAVRAGCIPIYHAHPTVTHGILKDAAWVDPADYGLDPTAAIQHALGQDIEAYQDRNERWLASDAVLATRCDKVYERVARILQRRSLADRSSG